MELLDPSHTLAARIQRASFALTMIVVGTMVAGLLLVTLLEVPKNLRRAHQSAAGVVADAMSSDVSFQIRSLRELSQSPLVWTSLSDSAGREAYLRPFLEGIARGPDSPPLLLVDYRGRPVVGRLPPGVNPDWVRPGVDRSLQDRKPHLQIVGPANKPALLMVFPVIYPYTQDATGALIGVLDLESLFRRRADSVGDGLDVQLLRGEHAVFTLRGTDADRFVPVQASLPLELDRDEAALGLRLYAVNNPWVAPVITRLLVSAVLALLLATFAWRLSGLLARRTTARLNRLVEECQAISDGKPVRPAEDGLPDEIGVLSRTLHRALQAYDEVNSRLEQRVAERTEQLSLSEERFRSAIDAIEEPFAIFDRQDRLVYSNQPFRAAHGDLADLITPGRSFEAMARAVWLAEHPNASPAELVQAMERRLAEHRRGFVRVRSMPGQRWVRDIERRTSNGYTVALRMDITELVIARQEAEAAAQAKGRFLATMSHELRTPLNGVLGMARLLQMPDLREDERREFVQTIINSGESLLRLLNDILDFSRIETGNLELELRVCDPARIVQETASLFRPAAEDKQLTLTTRWDGPAQQQYLIDESRLRQILLNLLSNAVKFTPQGAVGIEGREISSDDDQAWLEFSVLDTGIGMAREHLALLFQPFSQIDGSLTRQYGGSGLGLSIVRGLTELLGGRIGVESAPGKGSRFWLRIPVRRVLPHEAAPAEPEAPPAPRLRGRVLVVDDHPINRKFVQILLQKMGLDTAMAEDGDRALDELKTGEPVDAVLMDLQMPVLDGIQAVTQWRQWEQTHGLPRLPIIAISANASEELRQRAQQAGMDAFLAKPLQPDQLRETLARCLPAGLSPGD